MGRTGKVDDAEVDDELGDSHAGEVLLPLDLAAASRSPVVIYVPKGDQLMLNDRLSEMYT